MTGRNERRRRRTLIKLLIVDDERHIREGIARVLDYESIGVTVVGLAENGAQALELARETQPDILLTDICMPVMDGLELSRRILSIRPEIKILIISGYDDFAYARQAIENNVAGYLLKPVDPDELYDRLVALCARIRSERIAQRELTYLRQMAGIRDADPIQTTTGASRVVQSIIADINQNYAKNINLSDLAEKYKLSYSYLSLLFKKETNLNIIDYLNSVRIERAKELMQDPTMRVSEISDMVGIADSHYFARLFKKYTGKSPTEYRAMFLS